MKAAITGARPSEHCSWLMTKLLLLSKVVTNALGTTMTKAPLRTIPALEAAAEYGA
jgi:hypothetical protein